MRLFKYLGKHLNAIVLVFVLLVAQAFCDLMLPNYTSQIVDVGIQQAGIDHASTIELSAKTYDAISLQLEGEDAKLFAASYERTDSGTYGLTDYGFAHRDKLDTVVEVPLAELLQDNNATDAKDESLIGQQAIAAARAEYASLGYDMNAMQMNSLVMLASKMMAFVLLSVCIAAFIGLVAARTGAKIGRELRSALFTKVMSFSDAEVQHFSVASLITRATNDVQQIQMMSIMLLRVVLYAPILAIGGIIMIARMDLSMSWIIGVAIAIAVGLAFVLMALAMPKFRIMQKLIDRVNLVSREMLVGVQVVRAFGRQEREQNRFDEASSKLMKTQLFTGRVMAFMMPAMMMVMNIVSVAIVWVGAGQVDAGVIQTGDLIAFITYSMVIIMGFVMLSMLAIIAPRADVSAARIDEVLEAQVSITEQGGLEQPSAISSNAAENESVLEQVRSETSDVIAFDDSQDTSVRTDLGGALIEFDHVSFKYDENSEFVLHDVSFTAEPGKICAIIGPTGSGKSTALKLIERFYEVTTGAIRINGVDVRDFTFHELRSLLGYVPQKSFLFSGTVESNVAFCKNKPDQAHLLEAINIAQATEFVESKDDGLRAEITQGGTNLSGGQRQRLTIARALATDACVFLFDDCFSALDYKTDAALRRALAERLPSKTQIIVAQRIATVMNAHKIIVLDEGHIVGQGTHNELLASCKQYRAIAASQLASEEWECEITQSVARCSDDCSLGSTLANSDTHEGGVKKRNEQA